MKANESNASAHAGAQDQEEREGVELGANLDVPHLVEAASAFARESPHIALGIAAAIGFLLGGGLTPKLLGGVAMTAGRNYLGRTVRESLFAMLGAPAGSVESQVGSG